MDEFELDDTQNRGPRPGFLTVLCVWAPPGGLPNAVPRVPYEESLARSKQQPCICRGPALLCAHKCAAGLASTGAILLKLRGCPWGSASLYCAKQLTLG